MSIQVRFFASLRETVGHAAQTVDAEGIETVSDVWQRVGQGKTVPENVLSAVNMDFANSQTAVKDGDEVAFFPPVTGG